MSLSVRPFAVTDRRELASLVEDHLTTLEPGFSLLERRFPAGETLVDFLLLDARGRLVLCLLGSGSNAAMLVQAIEAYGWCCDNGALLAERFPDAGLDVAARPHLLLLAPRFSDGLRRAARHFGPLAPTLVECRGLEVNGERAVCFETVEGELADQVRERARELVKHLERLSFREAFR